DGEFWSDADFDFGYHDNSKRIKKQDDICAQIDAIFRDCNSKDVGKGIEIQHASTTNDSSEDDFLGQWEPELVTLEVLAVEEIGGEAQIPTFSLLDSIPKWALDRLPLLFKRNLPKSAQVIPYLMEAIKETDVEISNIVKLSPLASSSSLFRRGWFSTSCRR
ncbi:hypothetical protein Tco_0714970, partial [Tanacetum coccineum]